MHINYFNSYFRFSCTNLISVAFSFEKKKSQSTNRTLVETFILFLDTSPLNPMNRQILRRKDEQIVAKSFTVLFWLR